MCRGRILRLRTLRAQAKREKQAVKGTERKDKLVLLSFLTSTPWQPAAEDS